MAMATATRTINSTPIVGKRIINDNRYVAKLNGQIMALIRNALPLSIREPDMAVYLVKTLIRQRRAAAVRAAWEKKGEHIPAFMIASITHRCNLHCRGCYARSQHAAPDSDTEMSAEKLNSLFKEAEDLGVSIILLAGGEPLNRPEILDITKNFPGIIFPLFTNGTLIDETLVKRLKGQRNIFPVLSLEGHRRETDARRGEGTYFRVLQAMEMMRRAGIFFGTSITVTRENFLTATDEFFMKRLIHAGCRLFFFVDYVPVDPGTEALALTPVQSVLEARAVKNFREKLPALFIAFPGDEEMYGGCLAAGRGFIHVSPEGWVEPCPASPYSDSKLDEFSLKEAFQSPLLKAIRESGTDLMETGSGCALFKRQEWVKSLAVSQIILSKDAPAETLTGRI